MGASDTVKVTFFDKQKNAVKEFSATGPTDNKITLSFDAATTALFEKGSYTYDVLYTYQSKTTLARGNRAKVE